MSSNFTVWFFELSVEYLDTFKEINMFSQTLLYRHCLQSMSVSISQMSKSFHKLKTVFLIIWTDDISLRLIL